MTTQRFLHMAHYDSRFSIRSEYLQMIHWDYLLLLAGSCQLLFASDPQPRFSGVLLVTAAALGVSLREHEAPWAFPGAWYAGSIVYATLNLIVFALSPAQLLLLFILKNGTKPKTGIVVHHPKSKDNIEKIHVDIVAVHGLGSNPDWAWTHGSGTMWLKDLLPGCFPNARIMAFNHNSKWNRDSPVKSIEHCGKELLDNLNLVRKGVEERPIIFIGHSFGGIIIKKALVIAGSKHRNDSRYKSFEKVITGIIFLGVPHDGSRLTAIGKLLSHGTYWLGSSTEILESLKPGARELRDLNNTFLTGYQGGLKIISFWEMQMTKIWNIPLLQAVDENSATIPGGIGIPLDLDHVGMNKFESEQDNCYGLVKGELDRMVGDVLKEVRKTEEKLSKVLNDEMKECLETLIFDRMESRRDDVDDAEASTFGWIWKNKTFREWDVESSGVFWVLGKPGSGKSTFIKYVLDWFPQYKENGSTLKPTIASFFFHNRGGILEKSSQGFLQTIIHQILLENPSLFGHILLEYRSRKEKLRDGGKIQWPLSSMSKTLKALLADPSARTVYIFIDAMDECEEGSKQPMKKHLMELARTCTGGRLKLFVTSRPEPWLTSITTCKAVAETLRTITLQNLNQNDVESYINNRASNLETSHQEYLKGELISRSDGVFLWAKLVIDMLEEIVSAASLSELKEMLGSVPAELTELYTEKMNELSDNERKEAIEMLRWVILAGRPLSLEDLRYALAISIHKFSSIADLENSDNVQNLQETEGRIRKYSGGLLEVRSQTVQVIHQSVKDFFLSTDAPFEFRIDKSTGHTRLAVSCVSFLSFTDIPEYLNQRDAVLYPSPEPTMPFLKYSREFWAVHSRACDLRDSCYIKAMRRLFWGPRLGAFTMLDYHRMSKDRFDIIYEQKLLQFGREMISNDVFRDIPSLYENCLLGAARWGCGGEVRFFIKGGADVNAQGGHYGNALQAAVVHCDQEVVKFLIESGADVNAQGGHYGSALQAAVVHCDQEVVEFLIESGADVNAQGGKFGSALQAAAACGGLEVVEFLIESGADVNAQGGHYGSALQAAVVHCDQEVVKFLIESGADVNAQGGRFGSALQAAAACGGLEVVEFLIESGADVNAQGGHYGSALQAAADYYHLEVVEFLIGSGADVNAQGGEFGSALQAAAACGGLEVVEFLIESGADVNAQGGRFGNALQAAAIDGGLEVVRFLIESGADVNAQGGRFGNALQAAAIDIDGDLEVVRFLIESGADVNAQGGRFGNALQAAIKESNSNIETLLRDNGAVLPSQITEIPDDSADNVAEPITPPNAIPVDNNADSSDHGQ
ncbi:hypothetical protein DFP73DRAFT_629907 [Morchella snyderi]|nr:hypothetical protein DFP73DRAFT_629907 [Morchella snyderi]